MVNSDATSTKEVGYEISHQIGHLGAERSCDNDTLSDPPQ
jgi:hypothetical protein